MYARLGKYREGIKCFSEKETAKTLLGIVPRQRPSRYILALPPASKKEDPSTWICAMILMSQPTEGNNRWVEALNLSARKNSNLTRSLNLNQHASPKSGSPVHVWLPEEDSLLLENGASSLIRPMAHHMEVLPVLVIAIRNKERAVERR